MTLTNMAIDVVSSPTALGARCREVSRFDQLVQALKDALGPSSGLTSDDIDVNYLSDLMRDYDSSDQEWSRYAFGDSSRGYTRNLVDEGNGKSNLVGIPLGSEPWSQGLIQTQQLVLVWSPGKGSPIHDHGNAHCLMKILRGNLTETRYNFPESAQGDGPMKVISKKTYKENQVAYMADELGLHRVTNEGSDFAVSLHCMHMMKPDTLVSKANICSVHASECGQRRMPYLR